MADRVRPIPFARAFAVLDEAGTSRVRSRLKDAVSQFAAPDGAYEFPMACRLLRGHR